MALILRLKAIQDSLEILLSTYLPPANALSAPLFEAMRYSVLGGGKRLRAFLAIVTAESLGGTLSRVEPIACALEYMHAYSLVHDDLPAMDDDALRRGKPTCHIVYGEATAILVGDALQALAFEILAQPELNFKKETQLKMIQILAEAAGARGMVKGQALDMASQSEVISLEALETLHAAKTGALIEASVMLGALTVIDSHDPKLNSLKIFAHHLGIAFQIQDDILDLTGDTQILGKTAGQDIAHNKCTYPALLGLEGAREKATWHHAQALGALGEQACPLLTELADFMIRRNA
jgi:geranylgeranyl pyrophosphate synthase